MVAEAAKQKA
jgi:hypothetical protein